MEMYKNKRKERSCGWAVAGEGQGDGTIHAKLGGQVQERVWKVHEMEEETGEWGL